MLHVTGALVAAVAAAAAAVAWCVSVSGAGPCRCPMPATVLPACPALLLCVTAVCDSQQLKAQVHVCCGLLYSCSVCVCARSAAQQTSFAGVCGCLRSGPYVTSPAVLLFCLLSCVWQLLDASAAGQQFAAAQASTLLLLLRAEARRVHVYTEGSRDSARVLWPHSSSSEAAPLCRT